MKKKVLVLAYNDNTLDGHAFSVYKMYTEKGYEASFLSLYSLYQDDDSLHFFYKTSERGGIRIGYNWFRLRRRFFNLTHRNTAVPGTEKEYCLFNNNNFFAQGAKDILKKCPFIPDIIVLGWVDYFISPKTIYDLYRYTKAQIIIHMADPHIVGGGCHFPCECKQYMTGCHSCPAVTNKKYPEQLYEEKNRYLKDIPLTLVGAPYDLERVKLTPFLKNKEMIPYIGTPVIPFVKSKEEARKELGIPQDDFVIMFGSAYIKEKRKGFHFLEQGLKKFASLYQGERGVTFLQLGKNVDKTIDLGDKINIVQPGYLDLDGLFTAFYASDVFCNTPIDDSGPYMVNYSVACGTPVLSFPVGIATTLVKLGETGYLAKYQDVDDITNGLLFFYEQTPEERDLYVANCRKLMKYYSTKSIWDKI